jgi:hypothetical protein
MIDTLHKLQKKHYVGIVGGSDLHKIKEQLGNECNNYINVNIMFTFSITLIWLHF